ncbi:MAG: hypothetical protein H7210_09385, partial [Pyrinomonadaceae bacterium]|nr:hypothetical protein [Phycisphaerales bacterium]
MNRLTRFVRCVLHVITASMVILPALSPASSSAQTTIFPNSMAQSIAVNSSRVYFANSTGVPCDQFRRVLQRLPVVGGTPVTILDEPACELDTRWMKADGTYLFTYGAAGGTVSVVRTWVGGLSEDPTILATVGDASTQPGNIDLEGNWVYWCSSTSIGRVRRDGSQPVSVPLPEVVGRQIAAAGDGFVYWGQGDAAAGSIQRINLGEATPTAQLVAGGTFNTPRSITLDSDSVYWGETNGVIKRTPLTPGGAVTTVRGAVAGGWSVSYLLNDATRLYWIDVQPSGTSRIMRVSKTGGIVTQIGPGNLMFAVSLQQDVSLLYWLEGTTANIRRTIKDAGAALPDFTWLGLEVTQGIQNMANAVPIVQGKPALVRGYARSSLNAAPNVTALLAGSRVGGGPLPGTPLRPNVLTMTVPTDAAITEARRGSLDMTYTWDLPASWLTVDDITLVATINSDGAMLETSTANNTMLRGVAVWHTPPICIAAREIRTEQPNLRTSDAAFRDAIQRFATLFPARDVWVYPQSGQLEELDCCTWGPPWIYSDKWEVHEDADAIISQLIVEEVLSSNPIACDLAGASRHRVAMIAPTVNTGKISGYASNVWKVGFVKFATGSLAVFDGPGGGVTLAQSISQNFNGAFGTRWRHVDCGDPDSINPAYPYPPHTIGPIASTDFYGYDSISKA